MEYFPSAVLLSRCINKTSGRPAIDGSRTNKINQVLMHLRNKMTLYVVVFFFSKAEEGKQVTSFVCLYNILSKFVVVHAFRLFKVLTGNLHTHTIQLTRL